MLSVEDARARILSYFTPLPAAATPLLDALGLTLAEDVVADFDVPPLPNSAMDGYAVRCEDVADASPTATVELPVIDSIAAGQLPDKALQPGSAIRIMTGAPVPINADAVVPFEDTDEDERLKRGDSKLSTIGIRHGPEQGENVRPNGEDMCAGEVVLESGSEIKAATIGVAASLGLTSLKAIRRPVVSIVSTGDELQNPGEARLPGKIYNSNAYSIAAAVKRCGAQPRLLGIARDSAESLSELLDDAIEDDMVVTSAGVSKGDYDVVKDVLAQRGRIALWSVRMRPAKPLAFGALSTTDGRMVPHLGLPGNPVSALVAFEQFGRAAIRVMMGQSASEIPVITAEIDDPIYNRDGRRVYARVVVYRGKNGEYRARTTGNQSSGALISMAIANGLAICPDDVAEIPAGDSVTVQMLGWPDDELLAS